MLFVNKDHTRLQASRVWTSFILILVLCLVCMLFVDRPILLLVYNELPDSWSRFFEWITLFGGGIWITGSLCLALACYLLKRFTKEETRRKHYQTLYRKTLFVLSSILFSGLLLNIVKTMIGRLRPQYFLSDNLYGFQPFNFNFGMNSFPSGHSQTIWAVMVSLAILYPRFSLPFIFCATVVAASRVLIGAHFVSDVIMGSYMGMILTLYLYTRFIRNGWLPRFTVDDWQGRV